MKTINSHSCTLTLLHSYSLTLLHSYTFTLLHFYTFTLLHSYTLTLLHSYTLTPLHTYTLTHLHTYTLTLFEIWKSVTHNNQPKMWTLEILLDLKIKTTIPINSFPTCFLAFQCDSSFSWMCCMGGTPLCLVHWILLLPILGQGRVRVQDKCPGLS